MRITTALPPEMDASCVDTLWPCPLRVVVVDDSPSSRTLLTRVLTSDPRITVVGVAQDPYAARTLIKATLPDMLILDVEMPRMNGVQFLRNVMRLRPMPVVMVSGVREHREEIRAEAMAVGASGFISKPSEALNQSLDSYREEVLRMVLATAETTLSRPAAATPRTVSDTQVHDQLDAQVNCQERKNTRVIALGASTGGPDAVRQVLASLPRRFPPLVIAQHMPERFVPGFVERLNQAGNLRVIEAREGLVLESGVAYVAPGNRHLRVVKGAEGFLCALSEAIEVNHHRPSVDVLFESVAEAAKSRAMAVLLTGMGKDGALGMKRMHDAGALTIAQDAESSLVWGMPREAVLLGAADLILSLDHIGPAMRMCSVAAGQSDRR